MCLQQLESFAGVFSVMGNVSVFKVLFQVEASLFKNGWVPQISGEIVSILITRRWGVSPLAFSAFYMASVLWFSSGWPWAKAGPQQLLHMGG